MLLTDYTSYDNVRAALGVSVEELSDETLSLELYSSNLSIEISDINAGLDAAYSTLKAKADRTASEQAFFEAIRLFAAYVVAKQCCGSISMFGPKEVSDSKAAMVRFSDSPYRDTAKAVYKQYEAMKLRVTDMYRAYASASGTRVARVFFGKSSPAYDPITG